MTIFSFYISFCDSLYEYLFVCKLQSLGYWNLRQQVNVASFHADNKPWYKIHNKTNFNRNYPSVTWIIIAAYLIRWSDRRTDRCQDAYDVSIWSELRGEPDQVRVGQKIKPGTILHSAAWNSCPVQCPAVFKCFKCT